MEHHSFSQGRPSQYQFQTVSTAHIAPTSRFDFWCTDIVRSARFDPPTQRQRQDFQATVLSLATSTGEMHYAESDPFNAHITRHTIRQAPCDELALMLVFDGQVQCRYENDETTAMRSGDFFLLDGSRPTSLYFSRHAIVQIDLQRSMLEAAFGGCLPAPGLVNAALAQSGLAGLLRDHLRQFPRVVQTLAPIERLALLDASEAFAVATIQAACEAGQPFKQEGPGLYSAAQRYIKRHLAHPDLSPDVVAAGIGCSRSTLYREFASRELTVQGYIRELRLQQLMRALQKDDRSLPIQTLAMRCGLYDSPNVNRMFRKRFGMSPTEAKAQAGRKSR